VAAAVRPRRGERGFAADQRAHGGDPRLSTPAGTVEDQEPAETAPEPPTARRRGNSARGASAASRPVSGVGVSVNDGAGFILGLLAWVLTMQYIRGGRDGVKAWLRAKFLNQTSGGRP
jgi:hypothetical protein